MTKTSKKILITLFSLVLTFCTFLGIILATPILTVNAESKSLTSIKANTYYVGSYRFETESINTSYGEYYGSYSMLWFIPNEYYDSTIEYGAVIFIEDYMTQNNVTSSFYDKVATLNPQHNEARIQSGTFHKDVNGGYLFSFTDHVYSNDNVYGSLRNANTKMVYVFYVKDSSGNVEYCFKKTIALSDMPEKSTSGSWYQQSAYNTSLVGSTEYIAESIDSSKGTYYGSYSMIYFMPKNFYSSTGNIKYGVVIIEKNYMNNNGITSNYHQKINSNMGENHTLYNFELTPYATVDGGYLFGINDHVYSKADNYNTIRNEKTEMVYVFYALYDTVSNNGYGTQNTVSLNTLNPTVSDFIVEPEIPEGPEEPEEPEDEIPDVPTGLPTTDSTDYDVTYLPEATSFKGSYLVVPENITTGNTIMFHLAESPSSLNFDYAHYIIFKSDVGDCEAQMNPIAVTYRYGVKSYVYDFTKDQILTGVDGITYYFHMEDFDNDPVIASFGDGDVTVNDCYLLTPKNNAGVPGDELPPADTETPGNENPGNENPGNENPSDEAPDKKEPTDFDKFLQKIDNFFAENTGIFLGSTGSLVVLVIVLLLLFRRR